MAVDATGTPTSPDSIPKYNTAVDAPSGLGSNAQMDAIQVALSARVGAPAGIISGEVPVWNGSAWVRSSVTGLTPSGIAGYPADGTKHLMGDGTWGKPPGTIMGFGNLGSPNSTAGSFAAAANILGSSVNFTADGVSRYGAICSGAYWTHSFAGSTTMIFNPSVDGTATGVTINATSSNTGLFTPFAGFIDFGVLSNASHAINARLFSGAGATATIGSGFMLIVKVT
jgi:hypothetical protein